jgi:hypothetical protein
MFDGKFKGVQQPSGVFVYQIIAKVHAALKSL